MPTSQPPRVALAVFDKAASRMLASHLRRLGCISEVAESLPSLETRSGAAVPTLTIVELGNSATPIAELARYAALGPVIALAMPNPELFFQAARLGAEAVFPLPLDPLAYSKKLQAIVRRLKTAPKQIDQQPAAHPQTASHDMPAADTATSSPSRALHATIPSLFARSEDMAEVREMIEKVAPTSAAVLIRGESGVGKELAARLIHSYSLRAERAFIKVNCAAIPNELLESELFGFEAGAFTGAVKAKPGKFEMADGGTIFLDEIGEMHPVLQAKLLHVLQDGDFARLGSKRDIAVDVRVICATNRQLDVLVAQGLFREDLYYRVNVITISLPPLRARKREIPELLDHFVRRYAEVYNKPAAPFDPEVISRLMEHTWPGNIRELENLCKRYVIVGSATQIMKEMTSRRSARAQGSAPPLASAAQELSEMPAPLAPVPNLSLLEIGRRAAFAAERAAIESMLRETRWNRREAARRLQISYKALLNKVQAMEKDRPFHQVEQK